MTHNICGKFIAKAAIMSDIDIFQQTASHIFKAKHRSANFLFSRAHISAHIDTTVQCICCIFDCKHQIAIHEMTPCTLSLIVVPNQPSLAKNDKKAALALSRAIPDNFSCTSYYPQVCEKIRRAFFTFEIHSRAISVFWCECRP
jgi:hypothetical protein